MSHKSFLILVILPFLSLAAAAQPKIHVSYEVPFPKPLNWAPDTISVMIIGDVMMHSKQLEHDCEPFLSELESRARKADFAVANMEFPLAGKPYTGYPVFSTPDYYADYVARKGFNVFLLGNNHVLDKGVKGLTRTLDYYRQMRDSVLFTGAAADKKELESTDPLILARRSVKIALINFTEITNSSSNDEWPHVNRMSKATVSKAFDRAKDQNADFIVALPHWGEEYSLSHNSTQQSWAEWLVDQGADVIVGSHTHVVQDTTHIKGVPVIYSVGNAVSNMSIRNSRLELAVTLRFVSDEITGEKKMLEPQLEFLWCTLPGMLTESYSTIIIKEWANRRNDWLTPSDYDNMVESLARVKKATGIEE